MIGCNAKTFEFQVTDEESGEVEILSPLEALWIIEEIENEENQLYKMGDDDTPNEEEVEKHYVYDDKKHKLTFAGHHLIESSLQHDSLADNSSPEEELEELIASLLDEVITSEMKKYFQSVMYMSEHIENAFPEYFDESDY